MYDIKLTFMTDPVQSNDLSDHLVQPQPWPLISSRTFLFSACQTGCQLAWS